MPLPARAALFYLLSLGFSWNYWGWMLASGRHVAPDTPYSHLPGLLGPLLAAGIATALTEGRPGLRRLLGDAVRFPKRPGIILALILAPPALAAAWIAAAALRGQPLPPLADVLAYPGLPAGLPAPALPLIVLLLNGYGEEAGWRGYLLPLLLPRLGRFRATLTVAALWLFWHLPLFWLNASMTALIGPMVIGWAIGLTLGPFVLSHLYLISGRSLPAVVLWHLAYNLSVATPATAGLPAAFVSAVVMLWGLGIAIHWARISRSRGSP
ncbi:CPBP family glutamic-type intramembrane protease [Acidimangrovimonas pyrenivorans]|uniref:Type II CAAX prenyl endopeptidase Rce1 family protein n=1 Tax=Acidimangrovimonas pyrenivorans TaxID=2030798 RepID=A0ABV7AE65_9RHOB